MDQEEEEHCSYAMQLVNSSVLPMLMLAAVKLEVLEIIAKAGPGAQLSASEIVSQIPTAARNPDAVNMLDRMLGVLATHSVLTCSVHHAPTPLPAQKCITRLYGLSPVAKYFVRNQDGVSLGPSMSLLWKRSSWTAGVEHVGGDMFESVPEGDAIFMKWILHDWSDDHCLKLLKNCYKALPDNGKVIVVEGIVPVIPDTSVAAKSICEMDIVMMTQFGGKERAQHEFQALAIGAGFSGITLECFVCNFWVMEFRK